MLISRHIGAESGLAFHVAIQTRQCVPWRVAELAELCSVSCWDRLRPCFLAQRARLRGLVKFQFGAAKGRMFSSCLCGVEVFMPVRVSLRHSTVARRPCRSGGSPRQGQSRRLFVLPIGKAVFPVARKLSLQREFPKRILFHLVGS